MLFETKNSVKQKTFLSYRYRARYLLAENTLVSLNLTFIMYRQRMSAVFTVFANNWG